MEIDLIDRALSLSREMKRDASKIIEPPEEGFIAESNKVIPFAIVKGSRGYIEKVSNQINGCYEKDWFDACAVMIRRLLETLIIECFEEYEISHKIQNSHGDFFYLKNLINSILNENSWNIGRNARKVLPKLKDIGDKSAHGRRFIAHLNDIKDLIPDIRLVVQELVYLAKLK